MIIPSYAELLKTHFELNVAETIDGKGENEFNELDIVLVLVLNPHEV